MKKSVSPAPAAPDNRMHERILGAAFKAFTEDGYAGTSTLDLATRAKVSKRDLYANFGSKHVVLVACIKSRADRMRLAPNLPLPRTRQMLASTLITFATNLVRETSHPTVIATFRLAIAEANVHRRFPSPRLGGSCSHAPDARRSIRERPIDRAHRYWRARGDGETIFWAPMGGPDGGSAPGDCRDARAGRGRTTGDQGHSGIYAAACRSCQDR
jgi:AcrR family transcriptional regulator